MSFNVAIRADASLQIGTGHVMRCLALAEVLRSNGAAVIFICRAHKGNMIEYIKRLGYDVKILSLDMDFECQNINSEKKYLTWLGTDCGTDADATMKLMGEGLFDWLIVDHYALDMNWERELRRSCKHIMVIDDLANRLHDCDLLVDQTLGRQIQDYINLVPAECNLLCGVKYALLRKEFDLLGKDAKIRNKITRVLIFFGGNDPTNETLKAINGVLMANSNIIIDIVLGECNPNAHNISEIQSIYSDKMNVHIQTNKMALLMSQADLAIGASGSVSWERCCLNLPAIVSVLSDNQLLIAEKLSEVGAVLNLGWAEKITAINYAKAILAIDSDRLVEMSEKSANLVDGQGVNRVVEKIFNYH